MQLWKTFEIIAIVSNKIFENLWSWVQSLSICVKSINESLCQAKAFLFKICIMFFIALTQHFIFFAFTYFQGFSFAQWLLKHFVTFFQTQFLTQGHQSYSVDHSRIFRGQKYKCYLWWFQVFNMLLTYCVGAPPGNQLKLANEALACCWLLAVKSFGTTSFALMYQSDVIGRVYVNQRSTSNRFLYYFLMESVLRRPK